MESYSWVFYASLVLTIRFCFQLMSLMPALASSPRASYDILNVETISEDALRELQEDVARLRDRVRQATDNQALMDS